MEKLIKTLKNLGLFTVGVIGHHYGSQLLNMKNEQEAEIVQNERDSKAEIMYEDIREIKQATLELVEKGKTLNINQTLSNEKIIEIENKVKTTEDKASKIIEALDNSTQNKYMEEIGTQISSMMKNLSEILEILDNMKKNGNKLTSSLNELYKFLDSLTLLQESAVLYILIFMVLILIIINILAVLLGN